MTTPETHRNRLILGSMRSGMPLTDEQIALLKARGFTVFGTASTKQIEAIYGPAKPAACLSVNPN